MINRRGCILKSLENSILNGILFGLELHDGELKPQSHLFPCCKGSGEMEDHIHNALMRCGLQRRLNRTQKIVDQFLRRWGHQHLHSLQSDSAKNAHILRHVSDTIKGYRPQGTVTSGRAGTPSELWQMAIAATWRFGINSHVVTLPQANPKEMFPDKVVQGPTAIFIEEINKLWDLKQAETLEAIVNYAYHTNSYLWLEFCAQPGATKNGITFQEKIARRITDLKNKSPYEFLDGDCVSRLKSLCTLPRTTMEGIEE